MNIGYRSWGGIIGLTQNETYRISGWHQKRLALTQHLRNRGHQVNWLSSPTAASKALFEDYEEAHPEECGALLIEMSNENLFFNTERIAETVRIAQHFIDSDKPIYLLYDDPALQMQVAGGKLDVGPLNFKHLTVWANADVDEAGKKVIEKSILYRRSASCAQMTVESFPFNALLEYPATVNTPARDATVYVGNHTGGRLKTLQNLPFPVEIYYSGKTYPLPLAGLPPKQPERIQFYAQFAVNLGLQDNRHKKLRWFTGRIFHALAAGVPSIVENDSFLAEWFTPLERWDLTQDFRQDIFTRSLGLIEKQRLHINSLLTSHGL